MMKNRFYPILIILFITLSFTNSGCVQDSPQWPLPERAKARLGKGGIHEIKYSPDGATLAVASSIGIWIYDAESGAEVSLLTGHTDKVNSISFSLDGQTIASTGDWENNTIRLWDVDTGQQLKTLMGHTDDVNSVSFSPDGNTLVSVSDDDTVRLWDAATGREILTLTGHTDDVNSVAFSPDGNTLASGSRDGTVLLWEFATTLME